MTAFLVHLSKLHTYQGYGALYMTCDTGYFHEIQRFLFIITL